MLEFAVDLAGGLLSHFCLLYTSNLASVNAQANTLAYTDQRAEGSYTQEITRQTPAFVSVRCARRFSVEGRLVYSCLLYTSRCV